MRYYSRENERAQRRILELERYNEKCQAGLAAMETCWNMVSLAYHLNECRVAHLGL